MIGVGKEAFSAMDTAEKTLILSIDCTQDLGPDRYFACGETKVVETVAGRYREAEGNSFKRFGYRFAIQNIGNRMSRSFIIPTTNAATCHHGRHDL